MHVADHDLFARMDIYREAHERRDKSEISGPHPLALALMHISIALEAEGHAPGLSSVFPGRVVIDAQALMGGAPLRFKEVSVVSDKIGCSRSKQLADFAKAVLIEMGFTHDHSVSSLMSCRGFPLQISDISNHRRIEILSTMSRILKSVRAKQAEAGLVEMPEPAAEG